MVDDERIRRARIVAEARYGFRWHLPIYVIVNAGLVLIWLFEGRGFHGPWIAGKWNTDSLRKFKEKFNPRFEERYLALPAGTSGAMALAALALAHLRCMKSVEDHKDSRGRDLQNPFPRPEFA